MILAQRTRTLAVTPDRDWPLHGPVATRRIEEQAQTQHPDPSLMQRAGLAVAELALAVAPHAQRFWLACGPGNNGGDGLEAAIHLHRWGKQVVVNWLGSPQSAPPRQPTGVDPFSGGGPDIGQSPPLALGLRH